MGLNENHFWIENVILSNFHEIIIKIIELLIQFNSNQQFFNLILMKELKTFDEVLFQVSSNKVENDLTIIELPDVDDE